MAILQCIGRRIRLRSRRTGNRTGQSGCVRFSRLPNVRPFEALLIVVFSLLAVPISAAAPRILAVDPPFLVPGTNILKLRGLELDAAAPYFLDPPMGFRWVVKESKKADLPGGLEAKDIGNTRLDVECVVPTNEIPALLTYRARNAAGETDSRTLRTVRSPDSQEELEPNGGLRQPQRIVLGIEVRGHIQPDKDVDVYRCEVRAGVSYRVSIEAARSGSLLDAVLLVHDERGRLPAMNDDADGADSAVTVSPSANFALLVSVLDAHDRGSEWHGYALTISEVP